MLRRLVASYKFISLSTKGRPIEMDSIRVVGIESRLRRKLRTCNINRLKPIRLTHLQWYLQKLGQKNMSFSMTLGTFSAFVNLRYKSVAEASCQAQTHEERDGGRTIHQCIARYLEEMTQTKCQPSTRTWDSSSSFHPPGYEDPKKNKEKLRNYRELLCLMVHLLE